MGTGERARTPRYCSSFRSLLSDGPQVRVLPGAPRLRRRVFPAGANSRLTQASVDLPSGERGIVSEDTP